MKPLHQLNPGERAFIVDMRNAHLCQKLFELGVFPGDMVEVRENNTDNHSILVHINNKPFNIYRKAAETIITNAVSFEYSLN
ncbi:MAG TPA: FeoA family protein [Chitinophagales bacterium]|nr:FeoA family protein [Chitinophagales bacterium]